MNAAFFTLGCLVLPAEPPAIPPMVPAAKPGDLPGDGRDGKPLLLGVAQPQDILAHRAAFRDNLAKVKLDAGVKARWLAIRAPFTLVAVFGSWCGDSHLQLPDLLALEAAPNPFIEVHYRGVYRDKALADPLWPAGCAPQRVLRVPTFYLFAMRPGGGLELVGSVVENPPRAGQSMAEALVDLLEDAQRRL